MYAVPISKEVINEIIPLPNFDHLASNSSLSNQQLFSDIENDIDCLLHWLEPYYPKSHIHVVDPSPRVKAAIRSCLKDELSQTEFIKLYINSIRLSFENEFKPFINSKTDITLENFIDIITTINRVKLFYTQCQNFLNLSRLPHDLFDRNLNSLFNLFLINNQDSKFMILLEHYLSNTLFRNNNSLSDSKLQEYSKVLISIGLVNEQNAIVIQLSIKRIKSYILSNCSGIWDVTLLEKINDWIKIELYPSFSLMTNLSSTECDHNYLYKLIKIAHDEMVSLRIKEIFQLIVNYPTTSVALSELYQCILFKFSHSPQQLIQQEGVENVSNNIKTQQLVNSIDYSSNSQAYQRAKLVDTFIQACHENILHSGANTVDVITTYTSTIKAFLIIDPKGVLLDKVVRPIRRYLKTREDIIFKLVHGLLNDNNESNELIELAQELRKNKKSALDFHIVSALSISEEGFDKDAHPKKSEYVLDELNWIPDPIDALPDFKKDKVTDIIESLISIFDLKEIFIEEFTKLFGERLINRTEYSLDGIIEHLDLLKERFGKNEFVTLDVMIRDIFESEAINSKLKQNEDVGTSNFVSIILSHLYWQTLCDNLSSENDYFILPPSILQGFGVFNSEFSKLKKGRNLKLLPSVGIVKLELVIKDEPRYFEVTPDKAAVIALFDDMSHELSLDHISGELNMSLYVASKALEYWVKLGILLESNGNYKSNE